MHGRWWVIAVGWSVVVAAAQPVPVAQLQGPRFNEVVRKEAPVAGDDIVGLAIDSGRTSGAQNLYVRRSSAGNSLVCIEVSSIDALYVASNTYVLPAAAAGTYVQIPIALPAPLGTSHIELFTSASFRTLAVLARSGDCRSHSDELLPTSWGTPPESATLRLSIAVQSGRSSASILVNGSLADQRPCEPLLEGLRTAFDALCAVSLPAGARSVGLRLRRCAFDDCANASIVNVDL